MTPPALAERKRGGCLTAFLTLGLIGSTLNVLEYLLKGPGYLQPLGYPDWAYPTVVTMELGFFVSAIGVWKWKKWGVYGLAAGTLVGFVFDLQTKNGNLYAVLALTYLAILAVLVRPIWDRMD